MLGKLRLIDRNYGSLFLAHVRFLFIVFNIQYLLSVRDFFEDKNPGIFSAKERVTFRDRVIFVVSMYSRGACCMALFILY
jgi:hypothetical protein